MSRTLQESPFESTIKYLKKYDRFTMHSFYVEGRCLPNYKDGEVECQFRFIVQQDIHSRYWYSVILLTVDDNDDYVETILILDDDVFPKKLQEKHNFKTIDSCVDELAKEAFPFVKEFISNAGLYYIAADMFDGELHHYIIKREKYDLMEAANKEW
jgi:hypothetical protein